MGCHVNKDNRQETSNSEKVPISEKSMPKIIFFGNALLYNKLNKIPIEIPMMVII
jgi:hypothetical protein